MKSLAILFLAACLFMGCNAAEAQSGLRKTDSHQSTKVTKFAYQTIRITTNAQGRVSNVVIVKSVGSPILDRNTIEYCKKNWKGSPNRTWTREVYYKLL